ncbi:class II aldolase, partial [Salmonella enterica subsp. enterica serovar Enteritidis]|nr:class II aldolase [Salmonella enterica subsp. enterica serovar Enteritidis]
MPLVNGRILLNCIQEKHVLAGAFNTTNLETTISILNAIERSGLPNFIQIAPTNAQLSGYDYIYEIVKRHADKMDIPVSLHLDHGKTLEDVKQAVRAGFTSVMIDGAALPLEENIAFTREAVDFCKSFGVPVEAELGAILGKEDDHVSEADC